MVNQIKESADGLALQVTRESRKAGLVEEDTDGNWTRLADVFVYSFDDLLLVVDADQISPSNRAELVATAARDTDSIFTGASATVAVSGNGYQVQLPGCQAAGMYVGDNGYIRTADGVLFIHDGSQNRLIADLRSIRDS